MSGPFVLADEFGEWTGMPLRDDLARVQAVLDSASALIRRYTGQILSQVTNDQVVIQPQINQISGQTYPHPRAYGELIFLPQCPVVSISSIVSNSVTITAYGFTPANGVVYRTDGLPWTRPATITYTHGYAETSDEFRDIRTVCMQVAARALQGPTEGPEFGGVVPEAIGWATQVFLTEGEKAMLPRPLLAAVG